MKTNKPFDNFKKREGKLIRFDFKNYKQNLIHQQLMHKFRYTFGEAPRESYEKVLKAYNDLYPHQFSLDYDSYLEYIRQNFPGTYINTMDHFVKKYSQKYYGILKIKKLLVEMGFREDDVDYKLSNVEKEFWIQKMRELVEKLKSKNKDEKKIIHKLINNGFTEEQIQILFPHYGNE